MNPKNTPQLIDLSANYSPLLREWASPHAAIVERAASKGISIWQYQPSPLLKRIDAAYQEARKHRPLYLLIDKVYPNTNTLLAYRILNKLATYLIAPRYNYAQQIREFSDLDPLKTALYDEYLGACYAEDNASMIEQASEIMQLLGLHHFPKLRHMLDMIDTYAASYGVTVEYNILQHAKSPYKASPFYNQTSEHLPSIALAYALTLWHMQNSDPDAPAISGAPEGIEITRYYDDSYTADEVYAY